MENLVEDYQCTGCMKGCSTTCGYYKPKGDYGKSCISHFPATSTQYGKIYLGLPRGMNKVGDFRSENGESRIRIWEKGTQPEWDAFNVPIWIKQDGDNLIVKTVVPRLMVIFIDIIEGATKDIISFEEESIHGIKSSFSMTPFDITEMEEID